VTTPPAVHYTHRDRAVLEALARSPLTTRQLLKLSQTFAQPFTAERPLRRRLQRLSTAGWLQRRTYHTASRGAPNYYQLTAAGYRLLNGPKAPLPARSMFRAISLGLQEHTLALADFMVHLYVSAWRSAVRVVHYHRENALRLSLDGETRSPDAAFTLVQPGGQSFHYLVEVDGGTEPVQSSRERESCEQKLSFYERYADRCSHRFRVLFVGLHSHSRLARVRTLAAQLAHNPARHVLYAILLSDLLAESDPLNALCFLDHHDQPQSVLPTLSPSVPLVTKSPTESIAPAPPLW